MPSPLADRIRPQNLDEIVGQKHLLGKGKALRRIIESGEVPNLIFYGPSGVGKTTVARIISQASHKRLHRLNGTNASLADIKEVLGEIGTLAGTNGIILYLDEIQYLNKKQQQSLLEYIENGQITLIASTTENPYFYIYNAVLSRSTVFEFKTVPAKELVPAIERAFAFMEKEHGIKYVLENGVIESLSQSCGGDARKAINAVELCALSAVSGEISLETAKELGQRSSMRYDKNGEEHYDLLSALHKSIRGSDPDAAIYYLARLLSAGDIISPCRRILAAACEDIGLARPQVIPIVKACVDSAVQLGLPEGRLPLANAVILLATSPKSNTALTAIDSAMRAVEAGKVASPPRQLQNRHFDGEDAHIKGQNYWYPHSFPKHYIPQQYLPDVAKDEIFYEYGDNKNEQAAKQYWDGIKGKKPGD
ncbi:MAG: replication-associated recombination protein A [Oscillospiraceae bacterium]|nr:replication-associated recombination protein A [Oscillospiraceae bacterium]